MGLKVIKKYQTKNDCYRKYAGRKVTPYGIVVHEIACNQENPLVFVNGWNKPGVSKGVHAFIGAEAAYETLPCSKGNTQPGWHCGGKFNTVYPYISFEMCESKHFDWYVPYACKSKNQKESDAFTKKVYKNAVEYTAMKCIEFGWNPLGKNKLGYPYILSHKEAHALGMASGHSDPDSVWQKTSMKYTMDGFRKDVKKKVDELKGKKKDDDVKTVTKVDKDKTNPTPPVKVTSSRRSKKEVVKALQTALNKDYGCGLSVDGDYGVKSKSSLQSHNIKKGSKSNSVKWIQAVCNELGFRDNEGKKLSVDGDWGTRTDQSVVKMQKSFGGTVDKIIGTGTMSKILAKYK